MSAQRGRRIVVASYNVHRCIGRDRRHDPERVARVIDELQADLLALQEVSRRRGAPGDVDQCRHLAEAAGMVAIPGPTLESGRGELGNALLTRFPPERVERVDLTLPGREPRGALDVRLRVHGARLRVIATHLGLRRGERRAQVARLLAMLDATAHEDAPGTAVLLGDMNEWARGASLGPLVARLGEAPAPRSFPAWRPLLPLDRIWVRPRRALSELRVHATPRARAASDHLPVRAVVRLRGDGEP